MRTLWSTRIADRLAVTTMGVWAASFACSSQAARAQVVVDETGPVVSAGATCHPPMTSCAEAAGCVDMRSDIYHCGECGNVCSDGLSCSAGRCLANWDIGFGLEASVYLGLGGIFGPGPDTFAKGLWTLEEPFGMGVNTGFDVGIRVGNWGLGFSYALQQYGAEADDYHADVLILEQRYLGYLRWSFANWFAGPVRANVFLELEAGVGTFGANFDGQRMLTVDQLVSGARLGFGLAVVGRLQVGAFFGVGVQAPSSMRFASGETTGEGDEGISFELATSWQAGLMVRYTLPLALSEPTQPTPSLESSPPALAPPPPPPAYLLLVTRSEAATREAAAPKVTETPAYLQSRAAIRRVAVAAPRDCGVERAPGAAGPVQGSADTPSTRCSADMAELELSLTRRGYVVIPWQTIARSADRAPLDVARQLGADVLFQVHSLERTEAPAATDAELVRSYFESDMYGQHGAQLDPGEMVAAQLRELAQVREVSFAVQIVHGVALDVQAIAVPTGQTIWLYQWRMAHRDAAATSTETLAVGRVRPEHVERLRQQEQQPTLEMRAWSATAPVTMPGVLRAATDPGRDVPSWLVQRLVDDLASRFQTGVGTIERGSMPNGR